MSLDLQALAQQVLADLDARTPNRLFARPTTVSVEQAYAIQAEIARLREARGERVIGYKIGCTSKAVQQQLGIGQPIFARLFESGYHDSGARVSQRDFANLAVEGELAIRLGSDVTGSLRSDAEWNDAIESVFPVIELHHYVLRSPRPCVQELIASGGMHAGFVVAEPPQGRPDTQIRSLRISIDGTVADETGEPWTMRSAIASLRWLASQVAEYGLRLSRGQIVLTGSPMRLHPVAAGSRIVVEAFPFGSCCVAVSR